MVKHAGDDASDAEKGPSKSAVWWIWFFVVVAHFPGRIVLCPSCMLIGDEVNVISVRFV